jgi:hypothetical protein
MNTKVKLIATLVLGLGIGCVIGSYAQFMTVNARHTRQLLKEYQYARDRFHLTDAEMAEFGKQVPHYFEQMEAQDRMAVFECLVAYKKLEKGDIESTKIELLRPISGYYQVYSAKGGDAEILAAIEAAGKEYPEIAAAIAKK